MHSCWKKNKRNEYWINVVFILASRFSFLFPCVIAGKATSFLCFFKCREPKASLRGSLRQWHPSWMPLGESLNRSNLAFGSSDASFSDDYSAQGSKKQNLLNLDSMGLCAAGDSWLDTQQGRAPFPPPEIVGPESKLWLKLRAFVN